MILVFYNIAILGILAQTFEPTPNPTPVRLTIECPPWDFTPEPLFCLKTFRGGT